MTYKVIVFPADTGIGKEAMESLKGNVHFEAIPLNTTEDGLITCTVFHPYVIEQLEDACYKLKADAIILAHDELVYTALVTSNKLPFYQNKSCDAHNIRYKDSLYNLLGKDLCPEIYAMKASEFASGASAPCIPPDTTFIVKPVAGQGSKGVYVQTRCFDEPVALVNNGNMACEYLPGVELTVDCFSSPDKLLWFSHRERIATKNGMATDTRLWATRKADIEFLAHTLNDALKFSGAWFFQVKADNNANFKIIDVGYRVAGASGINRFNGVNLTLLSLYQQFGHEVSIHGQWNLNRITDSKLDLFKSFTDIYVDWDDTIIINGKPNKQLLVKLFAAKLDGKKIHVVTRNEDIHMLLNVNHRLTSLFDSVTVVNSGSKAEYITPYSLFIDDSFYERRTVLESLPVTALPYNEAIQLI